jgi:hypothetical protein
MTAALPDRTVGRICPQPRYDRLAAAATNLAAIIHLCGDAPVTVRAPGFHSERACGDLRPRRYLAQVNALCVNLLAGCG